MARFTIRAAKKAVAEYLASPAGIASPAVSLSCTALGKPGNPSFLASVTFGGVETQIAADNGKVRTFQTVESVVQAFAKVKESNNGVYLPEVATGELFASRVPANIYTAAASRIVTLNRVKGQQVIKETALNDLLTGPMLGWGTGNAAQVAAFAETTAQKAAVTADIAAIDAEIVVQQAVVDSDPEG